MTLDFPAQRSPSREGTDPLTGPSTGLSERDRAVLEFEQQWWRYAGAKAAAVREAFGLTPTEYDEVLDVLLDRPEALAYDAATVRRLQRIRAVLRDGADVGGG